MSPMRELGLGILENLYNFINTRETQASPKDKTDPNWGKKDIRHSPGWGRISEFKEGKKQIVVKTKK